LSPASNKPTLSLSILDQAFIDRLAHAGGNGEAHALIATGLGEDCRIDPYQFTFGIDQGATGISRIDCRVSLNEVLVLTDAHMASAQRAYDAEGNGGVQTKGIS